MPGIPFPAGICLSPGTAILFLSRVSVAQLKHCRVHL